MIEALPATLVPSNKPNAVQLGSNARARGSVQSRFGRPEPLMSRLDYDLT